MHRFVLAVGVFMAAALFAAQASPPSPAMALATAPASQPQATSTPGPAAQGLSARLRGPVMIEENDFLRMNLDLIVDAKSLPADVQLLDLCLFENRCTLTLKDAATGKSFTVKPFDASSGMPFRDDGSQNVNLDGKALDALPVMFPLRTAHVPAGEYECTVAFAGTRPAATAPNYWLATLTTGSLTLKVVKETPKTFTAFVPKTLHRGADNMLRAHADDLEKLTLPIANGLVYGCATNVAGQSSGLGGGISGPSDPNLDSFIRADAAKTTEISITYFVTGTPPQHMWSPGSDHENYQVVWTRTYDATGAATTPAPKAH